MMIPYSGDPLAEVAAVLRRGRRILVTSHPHPDGDAIGSMLATTELLVGLGHEVVSYCPDPVPPSLSFLVGVDQIVQVLPAGLFDVTIILDSADDRMFANAPMPRDRMGTVVVIDHHKTETALGDVVLRDVGAASVGVLLYRLLLSMKIPISAAMAEALYCSLSSDTGSFHYQNTNEEALSMAAALVAAGAHPEKISQHIFERYTPEGLKLLTRILDSLTLSARRRCACLRVTPEMLLATGASPETADAAVGYARGLVDVDVGMLLRPDCWPPVDGRVSQGVRVSLRSSGIVDVAAIAERLGGGGHRTAAGATVQGDMETICARIFAEVDQLAGDAA